MSCPPLLMHLRVRNEKHDFGLWLPLFLLLPVILVVMLILSPLILIAVLALWPSGWGRWAVVGLAAAFRSFFALRGLAIDIQNKSELITITVI